MYSHLLRTPLQRHPLQASVSFLCSVFSAKERSHMRQSCFFLFWSAPDLRLNSLCTHRGAARTSDETYGEYLIPDSNQEKLYI